MSEYLSIKRLKKCLLINGGVDDIQKKKMY